MPDLIFCHGLESGPSGTKTQTLEAAGFDILSPDCRDMDLAARVQKLVPILEEHPGLLVVGSSYGGITALLAAMRAAALGFKPKALLLLAPALGIPEEPATETTLLAPVQTTILHGTRDEVCPIEWSRTLAEVDPRVHLVEVDDEHRLVNSLDTIVALARKLA